MKKLVRRLSRVADSSEYGFLGAGSRGTDSIWKGKRSAPVPEGHLPVYVGEEKERFVVSARLLNHPIFVELLKRSAAEYGYEQRGGLRIPCQVCIFERVLETLRLGGCERQLREILGAVSNEV